MLSTALGRSFFKEFTSLIERLVTIRVADNRVLTGRLKGFHPDTLSICLINAKDSEGNFYRKILINGNSVIEIIESEEPFDLQGLAKELGNIFPEVQLFEDAGVIWVMNKIKVSEDGVTGEEESPLIAERVQKIYDKYIEEKASSP